MVVGGGSSTVVVVVGRTVVGVVDVVVVGAVTAFTAWVVVSRIRKTTGFDEVWTWMGWEVSDAAPVVTIANIKHAMMRVVLRMSIRGP